MSTEVAQPTAGALLPEKVLAEFGKQVLSFNSLLTWGVLLLLITISYFAVRWYRMRKKSSVGIDATVWQGNGGLVLIFILVSLVSIGVGIIALAIYAYIGFEADFSQGSGSLVQAIWGSAATIAAALVAILLAQRAVNLAEVTNRLTAKQTPEYEDAYSRLKVLRDIVSFSRISTAEKSSVDQGLDLLIAERVEANPQLANDQESMRLLDSLHYSDVTVKYYFTLRLAIKSLQSQAKAAFGQVNDGLVHRGGGHDRHSAERIYSQLLKSLVFDFFKGQTADADVSVDHPNVRIHQKKLVGVSAQQSSDVAAFVKSAEYSPGHDAIVTVHLDTLFELGANLTTTSTKPALPLSFFGNALPNKSLVLLTPFSHSTKVHVRAAVDVCEIDFSRQPFGSWVSAPVSAQQIYLLSNFQSPNGYCDMNRAGVSALSWQEYFRMMVFFQRIVLLFDALSGPGHSVDIVMERLQSLEDAVDRWTMRNGWEISMAMHNLAGDYEIYLKDPVDPKTKSLEFNEKAVSMMFPRYRFPGVTGVEYRAFIARSNQLRSQWTGSAINNIVEEKAGAGLDRFRSLMTELHDIAGMSRAIRSVTAIDKYGNFMNPAGLLTSEKDTLFALVSNVGKNFEFEIQLMRFIARYPIACELHFRGLLPQDVQGRKDCTESISGIVDLLYPMDEGNAVTEYLLLKKNSTLAVVA